jgi:spore coat polysaccharide biosynthesis protein SpsF
MKIVLLIQARMGSSRLPGKMLLPLHGLPIIDWVVRRTARATLPALSIVATSSSAQDSPLAKHLEEQSVQVFRGPEDDVLERFRLAGAAVSATHIVRVCADNPLIWGEEIDTLIRRYLRISQELSKPPLASPPASLREPSDNLYVYNHIPRNNLYPDGLGAEMISFPLLEYLAATATLPAHREHCLSYIWDNPESFCIHTFDPPDPRLRRPEIKLDIDTQADYQKLMRLPLAPDSPPEEVVRIYKGASRAES